MDYTRIRVLEAMFALIRKGISNILEYNEQHSEMPMDDEHMERYMKKFVVYSIMWGISGSMTLARRAEYSKSLAEVCTMVELPKLG